MNLLLGSWNLRAFGGLTNTWASAPGESPRRDLSAVAYIAAIGRRFDVIALQEVKRDTTALRALLAALGPTWRFITSDATEGDAGNDERLTFAYYSDRVTPSGLVGEVVLPDDIGNPAEQFARTPYAVSFDRGGVEFILTTVHVVWGKGSADRIGELTRFASWMRAWADRKGDWNQNLLVMGDFNLDRLGDRLYEAFISTGLWAPTQLATLPRTIFDDPKKPHFYDQIAWFVDYLSDGTPKVRLSGLTYNQRAGPFNFVPLVYPGMKKTDLSWRMSDHYPLWIEFDLVSA